MWIGPKDDNKDFHCDSFYIIFFPLEMKTIVMEDLLYVTEPDHVKHTIVICA
jgi:hypothetical protein